MFRAARLTNSRLFSKQKRALFLKYKKSNNCTGAAISAVESANLSWNYTRAYSLSKNCLRCWLTVKFVKLYPDLLAARSDNAPVGEFGEFSKAQRNDNNNNGIDWTFEGDRMLNCLGGGGTSSNNEHHWHRSERERETRLLALLARQQGVDRPR